MSAGWGGIETQKDTKYGCSQYWNDAEGRALDLGAGFCNIQIEKVDFPKGLEDFCHTTQRPLRFFD